jgi:hypothetical protein
MIRLRNVKIPDTVFAIIKYFVIYSKKQTALNRTVYAAPPLAAWLPKNTSRAAPFVVFFSSTFCGCWSLLRKALIRNRKTSYTAGTLCASFLNVKIVFIMFFE